MITFLPILISLVGVILYLSSSNPKVAEIGRLTYFCGLLAFLLGKVTQF